MACGAASLYVPRYLSEIAPIAIRGGISTLNQARAKCALCRCSSTCLPAQRAAGVGCTAVMHMPRSGPLLMLTKTCHKCSIVPKIVTVTVTTCMFCSSMRGSMCAGVHLRGHPGGVHRGPALRRQPAVCGVAVRALRGLVARHLRAGRRAGPAAGAPAVHPRTSDLCNLLQACCSCHCSRSC